MNENIVKGLFTAAMAAVGVYFRELFVPVVILAFVMLVDYVSGLAKAWASNEMSSRVGIMGIIKKILYLAGVAVAIVVDWVVQMAAASAGLDLGGFYMFGLIVVIWLILNECISILENIMLLGVPIPSFLIKTIKKLKLQAEKQGEEYISDSAGDAQEDVDDG